MAQGRPSRQPAPTPQPPMLGGPGDEPELPPQEPTSPETPPPQDTPPGTVIRIGNREFTVDPELASEFEAHRREVDRKFSQQGRELGEMRAWRQQVESTLHPQTPQQINYDTAIFERPRETLERFGAEIEQRLTQRYEAAETQRRNWERFYRDNPDLAEDDRLVKSIAMDLMQHEQWRYSNDLPSFFGELAKESRQELLRISRKVKEAGESGGSRGRAVESGGTRRTEAPSQPPQPKTISDMLLEKQQKRRAVAE